MSYISIFIILNIQLTAYHSVNLENATQLLESVCVLLAILEWIAVLLVSWVRYLLKYLPIGYNLYVGCVCVCVRTCVCVVNIHTCACDCAFVCKFVFNVMCMCWNIIINFFCIA